MLAHGSGGESMQKLIAEMYAKAFPYLQSEHDAALINTARYQLAFTTDSFVAKPPFFPGGDIGSLAVHGTVNDLVMRGSLPHWISVSFILEEGFPMKDLERIVLSIAEASKKAIVRIVTGDTKVIERSHEIPEILINTSGIGAMRDWKVLPEPKNVSVGNKVIVSGDIGRHGMALMSVRNGLELDPPILSDSMPLNEMGRGLYYYNINPNCMRDATRGGVAAVLNEIARSAKLHIRIDEEKVPVADDVRGLAEILGYDPLVLANEGRFVLFVKDEEAEHALEILHKCEGGEHAAIIGEVVGKHEMGLVTAKTLLGSEKPIHMPTGEILPRIC
jgi:hydrogenase expression/formation protein HypE